MRKTKYHAWFEFFDTLEQAKEYAKNYMKSASYYQRKKYPASYHLYTEKDGTANKYICWTSYRTS